jgi:hypothetical protein
VNQKATLENAGKGIGLGDAGAVGMDDAGGWGWVPQSQYS